MGICVAIILVFFGIFYFFNFSPVQKKIEEQEKGIGELKKEMEAKISELNETQRKELESFKNIIEIKFKEDNEESKKNIKQELSVEIENAKKIINEIEQKADKSIKILEKNYQQLDLMTTWNEHYMWKYAKVAKNVMTCLIQCLHKEVKYKTTYLVSLVLKTIINDIDTFLPFYTNETQLDLMGLFKQISGFEEQKKEILEKGKKIIEEKKANRAL